MTKKLFGSDGAVPNWAQFNTIPTDPAQQAATVSQMKAHDTPYQGMMLRNSPEAVSAAWPAPVQADSPSISQWSGKSGQSLADWAQSSLPADTWGKQAQQEVGTEALINSIPVGKAIKMAAPLGALAAAGYSSDAAAAKFPWLDDAKLNKLLSAVGYTTGKERTKGAIAMVRPSDFLGATVPNEATMQAVADRVGLFDPHKCANDSSMPQLYVDPATKKIIGHEGRARMMSIAKATNSDEPLPVLIHSNSGALEPSGWRSLKGMLGGQDFGDLGVTSPFPIGGLEPITYENADNLLAKYGTNVDVPPGNYGFTAYPQTEKYNQPLISAYYDRLRAPDVGATSLTPLEGNAGRVSTRPPVAPEDEGQGFANLEPMIQDFVKSGDWSSVNDLRNTGLRQFNGKYLSKEDIEALSPEDSDAFASRNFGKVGEPDQYAHGGLVEVKRFHELNDPDFLKQLHAILNIHKHVNTQGTSHG